MLCWGLGVQVIPALSFLGTSHLPPSAAPAAPSAPPTSWEGSEPVARMAGCVQGNWEAQAFPYKTDLRSGLYLLFATGGTLGRV